MVVLDDPVIESLEKTDDNMILPSRLDAAIRALAPAATANTCVSMQARKLLLTLLAAQRRSLLTQEHDGFDHRGSHTLVSGRALLTLAEHGDDALIYSYLDAYGDNAALLGKLVRALSAAAEETPERATTARRIWPHVIRHVLELADSGCAPFRDPHFGDMTLASLIPNAASDRLVPLPGGPGRPNHLVAAACVASRGRGVAAGRSRQTGVCRPAPELPCRAPIRRSNPFGATPDSHACPP